MEGIIQLGNSILDDALSLCDGALQQRKLLIQKLLLQLLLLTGLQRHIQTTHIWKSFNVTIGEKL